MTSMIERVARALHVRRYGEWYEGPSNMTDSQRECLADARAAIEAMREPPPVGAMHSVRH